MDQSLSATLAKQYAVGTTNTSRTKAFATPVDSNGPAYDFGLSWGVKDFKNNRKTHSIVMRPRSTSSSPDSSPITGLCDIDLKSLSSPIHLCFGDPDTSSNVTWETILCRKKITTNFFELNVDLGREVGRKVFDWKRTHNGKGIWDIDWLSLKMVERENGRVVARFMHHPWYGKKRGYFEIVEGFGGGENWEEVVLLSGMAVLEYMRKIAGWSW